MIEPTRQEILERLARLSELAPDIRFAQLIANLAFMAAGPWDKTLWDLGRTAPWGDSPIRSGPVPAG